MSRQHSSTSRASGDDAAPAPSVARDPQDDFLSTHDLELALQIADKIWLMDEYSQIRRDTRDLSLNGALSHFLPAKGLYSIRKQGFFVSRTTMTVRYV